MVEEVWIGVISGIVVLGEELDFGLF